MPQSSETRRVKAKLLRYAKNRITTPGQLRPDARYDLIHALRVEKPELLQAIENLRDIGWDELIDWVLDRVLNPEQYQSEHHKWLKRIHSTSKPVQ